MQRQRMKTLPRVSPWQAPQVWCAALFALFYAVLLACWPALPTQDGAAWVFEGSLLRALAGGHGSPACSLVDALPPNAFAQLAIGGLSWLMPVEAAGRLYVAGCVLALCFALVYVTRARTGPLLAVLPLCAGYPLYHGFLNYLAALPVLGFGLGALLRNPEARGARGLCWLTIVPLLLYCCHGTAVAVWGVLLAVSCWEQRSQRLLVRAAVSFIPVLCLLGLYVLQRNAEGAGVLWSAGSFGATVSYRLRSPLRFFSVFHGLAPTYDDPLLQAVSPVLVAANVVYAIGLCAVGLLWAVRARNAACLQERMLARSVLLLTVCFLLLPHDVAKMLNPAERLLLPAAVIAAAGLSLAPRASSRLVRWASAALVVMQAVYVSIWGGSAARASQALIAARAQYGFDAPVVQARQLRFAPRAPALGAVDLLPRHQVLAMQGMLQESAAGHLVAPFDTGLFRCVLNDRDNPTGWERDDFRRHERPLILIGEREHTRELVQQFGASFQTLQVGTGFNVVQRTAARP
jgi:hypothetical protein